VKLTSSDGKPISAARVTVRFFMAGMPEMGMAEMSVTSQLIDRGNGVYGGEVELGSGGTFQVTVSAEQAGKTVLTKRKEIETRQKSLFVMFFDLLQPITQSLKLGIVGMLS
jgi:YtkA-like